MSKKDYLQDLSQIRSLMDRSTRFLSLSGLSGILAGIYAIIGAFLAKQFLFNAKVDTIVYVHSWEFKLAIGILLLVALISIITAYILSAKRAKKNGEHLWNAASKRMVINFLIPFITGGIYILIKLNSQHYGLTASLMLIFYGLGLVSASKYTVGTIKYLGITEIILGLICAALPGYGFLFWVTGFGVLHIIYGIIMYRKEQ